MVENNRVLVLAPLPNQGWIRFSLGDHRQVVEDAVRQISKNKLIQRLWNHDHTIWSPDPKEITNRLGWLNCPEQMPAFLPEIIALREELIKSGIGHVLLLGMGGSSLAPDLFSKLFPAGSNAPELSILDSTDPDAVRDTQKRLDPARSLYIVSTKSGTTEETISFFRYFYQHACQTLGSEHAGDHFIAITDPGSKLQDLAQKYHFRKIFLNDPNLGGRYSALSHFGLVPATLKGIDTSLLLERARELASLCSPGQSVQQNPAVILGTALGTLAISGRDKLTFVISPGLESFADWVEQLIAESTGKEGKGILPVVGEELGEPESYGQDRVFVHIYREDEIEHAASIIGEKISRLEAAGHPIIYLGLQDLFDIGSEFLLWEIATAIAGAILNINPFDQPNVEAAKVRAREMVSAYKTTGSLPAQKPTFATDQVSLFSEYPASSMREAISSFLKLVEHGDYIAIQAYLPPDPITTAALRRLQATLRAKTRLATTIGYGPRFLHSTGQLHKGDRGNGLFILLTGSPEQDIPIPDEISDSKSSMTFGVLIMAQALGDQTALADAGRRLIRFHLHQEPSAVINFLEQQIRLI